MSLIEDQGAQAVGFGVASIAYTALGEAVGRCGSISSGGSVSQSCEVCEISHLSTSWSCLEMSTEPRSVWSLYITRLTKVRELQCDLHLVPTNLSRYPGYFTKMTFGAKYLTLSFYHSLDGSPGKHLQIA